MGDLRIRCDNRRSDSMGLGGGTNHEIELDGRLFSQGELDSSAFLVTEMRRLALRDLMPEQREEIAKILERPLGTR